MAVFFLPRELICFPNKWRNLGGTLSPPSFFGQKGGRMGGLFTFFLSWKRSGFWGTAPPLQKKSAKHFLKRLPKELVRIGHKGCNHIGQPVTTTRAVLINVHTTMSWKLKIIARFRSTFPLRPYPSSTCMEWHMNQKLTKFTPKSKWMHSERINECVTEKCSNDPPKKWMNVCADMDGWMRTQWSLSVWWGRSSGGTLLPRWNADYKNKPQNKQKLCYLTCQDCNFDDRLSLHPLEHITFFVVLVFLFF